MTMKDGDRLVEQWRELKHLEALKWKERRARDIWLLSESKPMLVLPVDLMARLGMN